MLVSELNAIGVSAFMDDYGYTYAKIEKNCENAYSIGLIAHVGYIHLMHPELNVNPRIHSPI